jgi:hypothetical protein
MKLPFFFLITVFLTLASCSKKEGTFDFRTETFQLGVDDKGHVKAFLDAGSGVDYLAVGVSAPLLSIRIAGEMVFPEKAYFDEVESAITLSYPGNLEAKIKVGEKPSHLVFELLELQGNEDVELIAWGPYPTIINKIIGETVGVVQGEEFAIGIQALNPKTLGGYPWTDNDCMPQIDIFESGNFSDLSEAGKREVLYRVEAAKPEDFGSTLQAYCRNRNKERITANWDHEQYLIPTFDDGGVLGSKIALFGVPVAQALETIGKIELAEGLPHPLVDGQWGKTARTASAAYMIMEFGEDNIDEAIEYTLKAGLRYLYHPGPFENWGHFELRPQEFSNGWDGLRACVQKAGEKGVMVGVHTLSNFITTNDPYVTPVPDERLARVGSSLLIEGIDAGQPQVPIASPDFFNQYKNNNLRTVRIGKELIRYGSVSKEAPWRLLDCQRGAFNTSASAHSKDEEIHLLADHAYKVFLTNPELTVEMSRKIAELFAHCGLRQISFDGLEGNRSTGMGNYGEILFTTTWYDNLPEEIKSHFIADASRTSHYFWHIYTRMNWGEPWYAGFRESQTEYRLKNQKYFQRNFMPGMLGWFSMHPTTSVEDIEWMLARSAGFDAGYGFVTSLDVLKKNGKADEILRLLGEWEKARMANAFTTEQKQMMQDISKEYRLETAGDGRWNLLPVSSYKFKHEKKTRQPGEPLYSTFEFENPAEEQPLQFILTAVDAAIRNITLEIDNHKVITLPVTLKAGESLKYAGGNFAAYFNSSWNMIKDIPIGKSVPNVGPGSHTLNFDCSFSEEGKEPQAKMEVRLMGKADNVSSKN